MKKVYIDNSRLIELITELTDKIVMAKFGDSAIIDNTEQDCTRYSDEAQDFFNTTYDEIENSFDTICCILSDNLKPAEDICPITAEDVEQVASSVGYGVTDEQIQDVLRLYPTIQKEDPTATWNLVVEQCLCNI
jgi:hypothetical protein